MRAIHRDPRNGNFVLSFDAARVYLDSIPVDIRTVAAAYSADGFILRFTYDLNGKVKTENGQPVLERVDGPVVIDGRGCKGCASCNRSIYLRRPWF